MNERVLFISGREADYIRNRVLLAALSKHFEVTLFTPNARSTPWRVISGLAKFISRRPDYDICFVGFYGQPLVIALSFLQHRPIILDAYVSTYDTLCQDRRWFASQSPGGRLAYWLDRQSCKRAAHVITDTHANADYFLETFDVPKQKISTIYVGCDQTLFYPRDGRLADEREFEVFYYGSFLPLHGTDVIIEAAAMLRNRPEIHFTLGGDGACHADAERKIRQWNLVNLELEGWIPLRELPQTVRDLPRQLPGVDEVESLVVDDGSCDGTRRVVEELGVDHIVHLKQNQGLAYAFMAGLKAALEAGADIVVNTDADNQYRGEDIERLIEPLVKGETDIAVGDRGVSTVEHFPPLKRLLQRWGSWVVERAAGIAIPDATSGFRAFTREAAMRLTVLSDYTYTLETLIQAGARRMAVTYVSISTNPQTRESRLMRNVPHFLTVSAVTILRFYAMYRPLRLFLGLGGGMIAGGVVIGVRFLYYFLTGPGTGKVQSLILAAILTIVGFQVCLIGLMADLVRLNRKMLEEALYRMRRVELSSRRERPFKR